MGEIVYRAEDIKRIPNTFFGMLEAIRDRPALFLGRKSLKDLNTWLIGYQFGLSYCEGTPHADAVEFAGFDAFVCKKYRWQDVGGWAAKIAYFYRDDQRAFDEFFKLLDEFRGSKKPRTSSKRHRIMKDSDTYMAILDEGREEQLKADILMIANERFGSAEESVLAQLNSITDLERLRRLFRRILKSANWQDLLGTP